MKKLLIVAILVLLLNSITNCKKDESNSLFTPAGNVTDIDGNIYNAIKIGNKIWMAENLKTTKYRNGDPIPNVTDNSQWGNYTTGVYCNINNDVNLTETYGCLYNWYTIGDSRILAPTGWHVATKDEWTILIDFLGGVNSAGGKLKETSTKHWNSPNVGATNESGFTALPGGSRSITFNVIGQWGNYWCSTEYDSTAAFNFIICYNSNSITKDILSKRFGFSIRCVKD